MRSGERPLTKVTRRRHLAQAFALKRSVPFRVALVVTGAAVGVGSTLALANRHQPASPARIAADGRADPSQRVNFRTWARSRPGWGISRRTRAVHLRDPQVPSLLSKRRRLRLTWLLMFDARFGKKWRNRLMPRMDSHRILPGHRGRHRPPAKIWRGLATTDHFKIVKVDFRTSTCLAEVRWSSSQAATHEHRELTFVQYAANCTGSVELRDARCLRKSP